MLFAVIGEYMETHADDLRGEGMTEFHMTRMFNKAGKITIANWHKYRDQGAFVLCEKIWQGFLDDSRNHMHHIAKVVPYRGVVRYDFS